MAKKPSGKKGPSQAPEDAGRPGPAPPGDVRGGSPAGAPGAPPGGPEPASPARKPVMSDHHRVCLNGINALTGEYLVAPMTVAEAARRARGAPAPADQAGLLKQKAQQFAFAPFALPAEVDDPNDLTQVGWAVVFTPNTPAAVKKALKPLLDRRAAQAKDLYKVLEYRPGESREDWLGRYGAHGSDVEPEKVPFFLLLVGDPTEIPFELQCLLDIDYAVGRLAFDAPA